MDADFNIFSTRSIPQPQPLPLNIQVINQIMLEIVTSPTALEAHVQRLTEKNLQSKIEKLDPNALLLFNELFNQTKNELQTNHNFKHICDFINDVGEEFLTSFVYRQTLKIK